MNKVFSKKFKDRKFQFEYDLMMGLIAGGIVLIGDTWGDILRDEYNFRYYYLAKISVPILIAFIFIYTIRRVKE